MVLQDGSLSRDDLKPLQELMVSFSPKVPLSKAQDAEKLEEYFLTSQCVVENFPTWINGVSN